MEKTIPPGNISPYVLEKLFKKAELIVRKKTGTIQVTELLSMLNFPLAVQNRIKKARGPVTVTCKGNKCKARNKGTKVEEDIPGTGGALGIIIHPEFECQLNIGLVSGKKTMVIDKVKGLDADIPGPINFDVDKITITLPRSIVLVV